MMLSQLYATVWGGYLCGFTLICIALPNLCDSIHIFLQASTAFSTNGAAQW